MKTCVRCGKEYDEDLVEYDFVNADSPITELGITPGYDRLGADLCLECALQAIDNNEYTEICECCGKIFNPLEEASKFDDLVSWKVIDADFFDGSNIYCAECAANKLLETIDEEEMNMEMGNIE